MPGYGPGIIRLSERRGGGILLKRNLPIHHALSTDSPSITGETESTSTKRISTTSGKWSGSGSILPIHRRSTASPSMPTPLPKASMNTTSGSRKNGPRPQNASSWPTSPRSATSIRSGSGSAPWRKTGPDWPKNSKPTTTGTTAKKSLPYSGLPSATTPKNGDSSNSTTDIPISISSAGTCPGCVWQPGSASGRSPIRNR